MRFLIPFLISSVVASCAVKPIDRGNIITNNNTRAVVISNTVTATQFNGSGAGLSNTVASYVLAGASSTNQTIHNPLVLKVSDGLNDAMVVQTALGALLFGINDLGVVTANGSGITNLSSSSLPQSPSVTGTVTATNFVLISPQWADVIGIPQDAAASAAPDLTAVTNGSSVKVPAYQQDDISYWQFQFPHNIAVTNSSFTIGTTGTNWHIEPHVHFTSITAPDATHSNVTFRCAWRLSNINGNLMAGTNTATYGIAAAGKHYILDLGAITNYSGISAIFACELKRIASVGQDIGAGSTTRDVGVLGFDVHVPVGNVTSLGSRNELTQ